MSVPRSPHVVVVGAGTAGAVLAARLASTSMCVVVLDLLVAEHMAEMATPAEASKRSR